MPLEGTPSFNKDLLFAEALSCSRLKVGDKNKLKNLVKKSGYTDLINEIAGLQFKKQLLKSDSGSIQKKNIKEVRLTIKINNKIKTLYQRVKETPQAYPKGKPPSPTASRHTETIEDTSREREITVTRQRASTVIGGDSQSLIDNYSNRFVKEVSKRERDRIINLNQTETKIPIKLEKDLVGGRLTNLKNALAHAEQLCHHVLELDLLAKKAEINEEVIKRGIVLRNSHKRVLVDFVNKYKGEKGERFRYIKNILDLSNGNYDHCIRTYKIISSKRAQAQTGTGNIKGSKRIINEFEAVVDEFYQTEKTFTGQIQAYKELLCSFDNKTVQQCVKNLEELTVLQDEILQSYVKALQSYDPDKGSFSKQKIEGFLEVFANPKLCGKYMACLTKHMRNQSIVQKFFVSQTQSKQLSKELNQKISDLKEIYQGTDFADDINMKNTYADLDITLAQRMPRIKLLVEQMKKHINDDPSISAADRKVIEGKLSSFYTVIDMAGWMINSLI